MSTPVAEANLWKMTAYLLKIVLRCWPGTLNMFGLERYLWIFRSAPTLPIFWRQKNPITRRFSRKSAKVLNGLFIPHPHTTPPGTLPLQAKETRQLLIFHDGVCPLALHCWPYGCSEMTGGVYPSLYWQVKSSDKQASHRLDLLEPRLGLKRLALMLPTAVGPPSTNWSFILLTRYTLGKGRGFNFGLLKTRQSLRQGVSTIGTLSLSTRSQTKAALGTSSTITSKTRFPRSSNVALYLSFQWWNWYPTLIE